jgi:hypothetical protein
VLSWDLMAQIYERRRRTKKGRKNFYNHSNPNKIQFHPEKDSK